MALQHWLTVTPPSSPLENHHFTCAWCFAHWESGSKHWVCTETRGATFENQGEFLYHALLLCFTSIVWGPICMIMLTMRRSFVVIVTFVKLSPFRHIVFVFTVVVVCPFVFGWVWDSGHGQMFTAAAAAWLRPCLWLTIKCWPVQLVSCSAVFVLRSKRRGRAAGDGNSLPLFDAWRITMFHLFPQELLVTITNTKDVGDNLSLS